MRLSTLFFLSIAQSVEQGTKVTIGLSPPPTDHLNFYFFYDLKLENDSGQIGDEFRPLPFLKDNLLMVAFLCLRAKLTNLSSLS